MNIIEKREAPPQKLYELVKALTFKDNKLNLAGSSGLKSQQYGSDYDFNTIIKDDLNADQLFTEFSKIIKRIDDSDSIYFVEFKMENTDGKKKKFFKPDDITKKSFTDFYDTKKIAFIKIDVVYRMGNEFMEASVIYLFNTEADDNYLENLKKDMLDYLDEGMYYKALKRLFSILKEDDEGNGEKLVALTKFFNSETGALYQFNSQLKALELLPKDKGTIRRINVFLKDHNVPFKYSESRIQRYIKKNDAIINKSGYDFLKII